MTNDTSPGEARDGSAEAPDHDVAGAEATPSGPADIQGSADGPRDAETRPIEAPTDEAHAARPVAAPIDRSADGGTGKPTALRRMRPLAIAAAAAAVALVVGGGGGFAIGQAVAGPGLRSSSFGPADRPGSGLEGPRGAERGPRGGEWRPDSGPGRAPDGSRRDGSDRGVPMPGGSRDHAPAPGPSGAPAPGGPAGPNHSRDTSGG